MASPDTPPTPPQTPANTEDAPPLQLLNRAFSRIRGDALRRSLFWTFVAWIPGAFWQAATSGVTQTKLAFYLGASKRALGVMTAAPQLGTLFLAIPGALIVEALGRRKGFFIWTVTIHRLLYVAIGLLPWIMPSMRFSSAALMIALILLAMGLNSFGNPAWTAWMADLVPHRVRGKYFAKRNRVGMLTMVLTTLAVGFIMDVVDTPADQALADAGHLTTLILLISVVFMVGGAIGMLDILAFLWVDEPKVQVQPEPLRERLMRPLRDKQFLTYCGYWSIWTFATGFCNTIWWLYLLNFFNHKLDPSSWWVRHQYVVMSITLPIGYQVGQVIGLPAWGRAIDRFGRKPVLFVSSTIHTISWLLWMFLCPATLPWMLAVQIFGGIAGSGTDLGNFNMMLQYNRKGGAGYQAVGSFIFAAVASVASITSGFLLDAFEGFRYTIAPGTRWEFTFDSFALVILIGAAIKYAGDLFVLPFVHDLDSRRRRETARFVIQSLYGSFNDTFFAPVLYTLNATGRTLGQVKDKAEAAGKTVKGWFK